MMNTKTLNIIQTISKIGRFISKIVFILCIVGFVGCIVGIIGLAILPDGGIKLGGVTIKGLIEKNADISTAAAYTKMAIGMIVCAGTAVVAKFADLYFTHELEAGTPFTFEGAKEMLRLGIVNICAAAAIGLAAGIIYVIMKLAFGDVGDLELGHYLSVGTGVMFIIMSLLCKYGAEQNAAKEQSGQEKV